MVAGSRREPCRVPEAGRGVGRRAAFLADEGGQISFLMLWSAVALAAFIGLLANTQQQTGWRVRSQAAADATSMAAATWVARGLNVTAACNAVQAQSLGGIIVMEALYRTYNDEPTEDLADAYEAAWDKICSGLGKIPYVGWALEIGCRATFWGCAWAQLQLIQKVMQPVSEVLHDTLSGEDKALEKLIEAMEKLNAMVGPSFSIMAQVQACEIAKANGASEVMVYRHSDELEDLGVNALGQAMEKTGSEFLGLDLGCLSVLNVAQQVSGTRPWVPVKEGRFDEICKAAWDAEGARGLRRLHGYPNGPAVDGRERILNEVRKCLTIKSINQEVCAGLMGPDIWPTDCLGFIPRFFFPWHVDVLRSEICGGSAGPPPTMSLSLPLATLDECSASPGGELVWKLDQAILADSAAQDVTDDQTQQTYQHLYETPRRGKRWDFDNETVGGSRRLSFGRERICGQLSGSHGGFGGGSSFSMDMEGCRTECVSEEPSERCLTGGDLPAGKRSDRDVHYDLVAGTMTFRSEVLEYEYRISKEVPPDDQGGQTQGDSEPVYERRTYYQYRYRTWTAQGCRELASLDLGQPFAGAPNSRSIDAKPYILDSDDLRKDLTFIAVLAFKPEPAAFAGNIFGSSPARIAFSSAETYNGLFPDWEPDNFSQDWRARQRRTDFGTEQHVGLSIVMQQLSQRVEGQGGLEGLLRGLGDLLEDPSPALEPFVASTLNNH